MDHKKKFTILLSSIIIAAGLGFSYSELNVSESEPLVNIVQGSMMNLPLQYLVDNADYAIVGTVSQTSPIVYTHLELAEKKRLLTSTGMDDNDTIIFDREILTDVTIQVEEDLFGKYTESIIVVRVQGGEIPGYITIDELSPTYSVGDRVTIFVAPGDSYSISSVHNTVLGMYQGVIDLNDIASSKHTTSTTTEQEIKDKIKSLKTATT